MNNKKTNIQILLNLKKRIIEGRDKLLKYKNIQEVTNKIFLKIKETSNMF